MQVRNEEQRDWTAVRRVVEAAFGTPAEADLVDALRGSVTALVSLVAEDAGQVLGHVMFTPVSLSAHADTRIMGLAPVSVMPERQRNGIGSLLVNNGLQRCAEMGFGAVVVLGHPEYYARFGFSPSRQFDIDCEFDAPVEAFMITELRSAYLRGRSGTISYHPLFSRV